MLEKYFPDFDSRKNYENQQKKFLQSGLKKIEQSNRIRMSIKLSSEEQDAIDYFTGKGFYEYYQNVNTRPNRYDTRKTFLLKMKKNKQMRDQFLDTYNKRDKSFEELN